MPAKKRVTIKKPNRSNDAQANQVMKIKKDNKSECTILKNICNFFLVCFFVCTALISFILLVGYYRSPIVPKEIKGLERVDLEGRYAVNDLLTLKKRLLDVDKQTKHLFIFC